MYSNGPSVFRRILLCAIVSALFASAHLAPAQGAVCTLADHIRSANTNTAVGFCPAGTSHDIITIAEDITLTEPLPPITGTITIEGGGHTISGDRKFRIFDVNGGNLTIRHLTLDKGRATKGSGGFRYIINGEWVPMDAGGALRLDGGGQVRAENTTFSNGSADVGGAVALLHGKLSVHNSRFLRNRSTEHDGGAIFQRQGEVAISSSSFIGNSTVLWGGAIGVQSGSVSAVNSTFEDNSAGVEGGVLNINRGRATLTHLTMVNNRSKFNNGDAISKSGGYVALRNSIVVGDSLREGCIGGLNQNSGNWSQDGTCGYKESGNPLLGELTGAPAYRPLLDGSPVINRADAQFCPPTDQLGTPRPQGDGCDIGAIESTTAIAGRREIPGLCTLPDQLIAANHDRPAGACPAGEGADIIFLVRDFTLTERLPAITSAITIRGSGFTISGDEQFRIFDVDGGELALHDLTLTKGRSLSHGGAILVENGGKASIDNSKFIRNTAGYGGAIATNYPNRGVSINNSEFRNNEARSSGGAIHISTGALIITNSSFVKNFSSQGGAIDIFSNDNIDISNSSFIDNRNTGGGVIQAASREMTLTHVTMFNNSTGLSIAEGRTVNLRNSLIASDSDAADCFGPLTQNRGNLIEDGSCAPAISGDPLLDTASDLPAFVSLRAGSPAIDAADPRFCPATDQLGNPRPQGAGCDIGAIEMPAPPSEGSSASVESPPRSDCQVTTTHALNFRDNPNGKRIGLVPPGTTLVASARTAGWFQVEYREIAGWISADYVVAQGVCG